MSIHNEEKIKVNALSTYLFIFFSWSLLLIKKDTNFNNSLVRNHAKTSSIIHILLFVNYMIFIWFRLLDTINVFGVGLNIIIADIIFFILLGMIVVGVYKALNKQNFWISSTIKIKDKTVFQVHKRKTNFKEEDKLTIVLGYIPFIGYIFTSKYDKNEEVGNIIKLNLLVSILITIIYIFGYKNVSSLLILAYIIFTVFAGIILFINNELIHFKLHKIFAPSEKLVYQKTFINYLKNYIQGKFTSFQELYTRQVEKRLRDKKQTSETMNSLQAFYGPKWIIYIPIINFISLFQKNTKLKIHIINGCIISLLCIVLGVCIFLGFISSKFLLLLLFPISFGIGKLSELNYKMPYIYDIYASMISLKNIFKKSKAVLDTKRQEVKEVSFKVGEQDTK